METCGKRSILGATRWMSVAVAIILTALMGLSRPATAQAPAKEFTLADYQQWMQKYADAKPDFKPGDVLNVKDLERMRPFIPPGYFERLNFPEFRAPIIATRSHRPRQDYIDCGEKYGAQVRLNGEGMLVNYTCGQPFSDGQLSLDEPQSGLKGIWNYEYKWQNYGLAIESGFAVWDLFGGNHNGVRIETQLAPQGWREGVPWPDLVPTDVGIYEQGGGTFQRVLQWYHQRVYFTGLAQLPNHVLNVPDAKDFLYKEFTGFFEPFDIRGTVFIIYRYADSRRADDAWAYIPNLRRVRRISAEVKSDSLLGTDATLEDFYGFSGREPDWNFKFIGWKNVLCVMDPKDNYQRSYGPDGDIPDDQWSLRKMAVVVRTPKDPRHPFSSVINFFDAEDWHVSYHFNLDRKGKLWKLIQWQWKYSDDYTIWQNINKGIQAMVWQHGYVTDAQNARGTLWFCGWACGYPNSTAKHVEDLYDINKLEETHR